MKPDKPLLAATGISLAAAGLIVLTWIGTMGAINAQRAENRARVKATLANQALTLTEQINRQILGLDQTLRFLVTAWENNPRRFELETWRDQAVVLNGLSRDMVLTDEKGIIRQSSVVEAINQNASGLNYFRVLSDPSLRGDAHRGDDMYIGPATIDGIMRQWHIDVARSLHHPDGSFAGVIDADYRIAAITDVFSQTDLGIGAFAAVVGLEDGKLRGGAGPATIDPDANVAETPMFAAVAAADSGLWTGPSASDAVPRIHAFRHIPGRKLAVIVAMNEAEAMRPASVWRQQAQAFAACITALLFGMALILIQGMRLARRRETAMTEDRAVLAAANAQLEVARAFAAAKAEQLEATLGGMSDGVSMVDGHMCLVEWNARFPEISGVPAEILRVGLPMEEMLRAQVRAGQFGWIQDHEAEVERRMARLRVAPYGVAQRQRPDGHTIELRRNRLPDGGFVTLYADITEHKRAEDALRAAQAAAETANAEKSRFVAIVSHEIRTPLNALLNTVRLLADSVVTPAQRSLLTTARRSGEMLFGLISDILVMSQIEAGRLTLRPSLFELRPLLQSCVDMFATQAAEHGMTLHVAVADGTPETLLADPGRLRQVQLNLLSNAIKYARPGEIWLTAEPGRAPHEAVRLAVRDAGPVIASDARERLFRPFSRLDRPGGDDQAGTGLGLSICRQLVDLMAGEIGCDASSGEAGRVGNSFWMTLPVTALPDTGLPVTELPGFGLPDTGYAPPEGGSIPGQPSPLPDGAIPRRSPPRTRILLTEDVVANQLVTATLLRRQGHHVDIVASGQAAIEAVQATPYDLVFMDIFMPGMSGQEATQIIRGLPEPACSIPIVALTASIGIEDEATLKAAGMDGVLGKPVSLAELLDVIRTHVWSALPARTRFGVHESLPGVAKPTGFVPVLSVGRLGELRDNLPPEKFAELLRECLTDMDLRLPALRQALKAGTPGAIIAHAHALTGMAAGYGMDALEVRLRTILTAATVGDMTPLGSSLIAELDADFTEAARQLRELPHSAGG
jgi:signal transduction histidine kinase/CheY-like chemotaxis protein